MANVTSIGRVIIPVSDQDKAIAFYRDKLGFNVIADVPFGEGSRWVELAPPAGGCGIAVQTPPGGFEGGTEVGIALESTDVRADHNELVANGVDCDDVMGGDGTVPTMFFFRDQDGNSLLIVEPPQR
jgi:catechol 2,3-dioxygenase-like lactoylglutathione lyase family enzyme